MPWWGWLLAAALLAAAYGLWHRARRLDRLQRRCMASRLALSRALVKRAADTASLAHMPGLDPDASRELAASASRVLRLSGGPLVGDGADPEDYPAPLGQLPAGDLPLPRHRAEEQLTEALRNQLTPGTRATLRENPLARVALDQLEDSAYRVRVTRQLHNQDVALVRDLRSEHMVRWFRLAGFAPLPQPVELDADV